MACDSGREGAGRRPPGRCKPWSRFTGAWEKCALAVSRGDFKCRRKRLSCRKRLKCTVSSAHNNLKCVLQSCIDLRMRICGRPPCGVAVEHAKHGSTLARGCPDPCTGIKVTREHSPKVWSVRRRQGGQGVWCQAVQLLPLVLPLMLAAELVLRVVSRAQPGHCKTLVPQRCDPAGKTDRLIVALLWLCGLQGRILAATPRTAAQRPTTCRYVLQDTSSAALRPATAGRPPRCYTHLAAPRRPAAASVSSPPAARDTPCTRRTTPTLLSGTAMQVLPLRCAGGGLLTGGRLPRGTSPAARRGAGVIGRVYAHCSTVLYCSAANKTRSVVACPTSAQRSGKKG